MTYGNALRLNFLLIHAFYWFVLLVQCSICSVLLYWENWEYLMQNILNLTRPSAVIYITVFHCSPPPNLYMWCDILKITKHTLPTVQWSYHSCTFNVHAMSKWKSGGSLCLPLVSRKYEWEYFFRNWFATITLT